MTVEGGFVAVAKLAIEYSAINPPKPLGISVIVEGKVIATVELEQFKAIGERLQQMEFARSARTR